MPARAPLLQVAAVMVLGGLLMGCAQDSSAGDRVVGAGTAGDEVSEQGYVSGDGATTIVPVDERVAAPDLSGTTLDGTPFALSDHLGEVVVLNVWASWCAPCRSEAESLQAVWSEVGDGDVQFVGLNTRDSEAPAKAFVDRFGITYPNVVDTDGSKQLLFHANLPPAAIPSTLVIDADGRVAARAIGEVDRSRLLGLIEPIIAERSAGGDSAGGDSAGGDSAGGDS